MERGEGKCSTNRCRARQTAFAEGEHVRRQDAAVASAVPGERGLHFQHQQPQKQEESADSAGGEAMFGSSIP